MGLAKFVQMMILGQLDIVKPHQHSSDSVSGERFNQQFFSNIGMFSGFIFAPIVCGGSVWSLFCYAVLKCRF